MSKAEKFIQERTMNCSNQIINGNYGTVIPHFNPWLTPDQALEAVKIAREEMFGKVCKFLDNDLCCYIKAQEFAIEHQRLENDLKQVLNYE